MLASAAVVGFLVTQPAVSASAPALKFSNLAAIQINAVIEKPAVAPLTSVRPAQSIIVRRGETLAALAAEYGSNVAAIRWANGLPATSQPAAGTTLLLPPTAGALVRTLGGETPTAFAQRLGLDPSVVLDYNVLSSNNPLPAGAYLQVPLDAAPAGALIADKFAVSANRVPSITPDGNGWAGFPYGQCTWYVATRRHVNWAGNAWVWFAAAAGIRPEGHVAVQGAIVVFGIGWSGHVAYVEHVNPDGSFVVSEMNYYGNGGGWGRIDRRTIAADDRTIIGFIY